MQTEVISTIRNDSTSQLIHGLSADGVIVKTYRRMPNRQRKGDWVFIAFLVAGFAILIVKAKGSKGRVSPAADSRFKDAFDRGEIDRVSFERR